MALASQRGPASGSQAGRSIHTSHKSQYHGWLLPFWEPEEPRMPTRHIKLLLWKKLFKSSSEFKLGDLLLHEVGMAARLVGWKASQRIRLPMATSRRFYLVSGIRSSLLLSISCWSRPWVTTFRKWMVRIDIPRPQVIYKKAILCFCISQK